MTNTKSGANAGTMMYQHKESLGGKRAEAYMDVYALGCIILELYTGRRVWNDIVNPMVLIGKIYANEYPPTAELQDFPGVKQIVDSCFKEPHERIGMADVLQGLDNLIDKDKY